ncbi:hypothetical protein PAECIP112173_00811 [Paenibacillus sp. JJ-100]|uniref:hypothetical protein n=1 Tax=Paenibacillus sp. JJ-100 TaxID=2974896 RepID=UPI0022FFAEBD|nr:hypothetical protein [Paenibacillus sp. JJ-100]CAI6035703.1 hypothetical protein PAECIP112173_00811 [Paenibacillus sp. JJ-100]
MSNQERALVKQLCISCTERGKKTNKEHIFPQWLLKKTNTFSNPITGTAGNKKIPGKHCVIPICEECNSELGRILELPVSKIFERIENNQGFNDFEAELLVRWMWKITSMFYWIERSKDEDDYGFVSVKDRCLKRIENPRERISIAISLIENEKDEKYEDTAMGIDVLPKYSNVLAAGVFNKTAIIVYYSKYDHLISNNFTKYQLSSTPFLMNPEKRILPIMGFREPGEAISKVISVVNGRLLLSHEYEAVMQLKQLTEEAKKKNSFLSKEAQKYFKRIKKKNK